MKEFLYGIVRRTCGRGTVKLPDLLKMIFDPQLFYRDPNKLNNPERNLLEHLVRHQIGGKAANDEEAKAWRVAA